MAQKGAHIHTHTRARVCARDKSVNNVYAQREHRRLHHHDHQDQANRIDNEPIKTISNVSPNLKHVVQFFEYK